VIALLFVITSLGATIIPASAVVVLLAPMAMTLAEEMGFSPYALMMTLGLAAAGSFNSPVSHPSNVMIMGPGGYRFVDYLKVGIPLSFLVLVVVVVFLPIFWPVVPQ
jgi:di/tricarboxylate transporter